MDGRGTPGVIPPGAFQEFGLSVKLPSGQAGDKLTFKALQTYDDGEVVRWIGPEDSDEPAPIVTLRPAAAGDGHGAPSSGGRRADRRRHAGVRGRGPDDGGSDALAIVALVVGALGLLAAWRALLAARRTRPRRAGGGGAMIPARLDRRRARRRRLPRPPGGGGRAHRRQVRLAEIRRTVCALARQGP